MPLKDLQKRREYAEQYRNTPEAKASMKVRNQRDDVKAQKNRKVKCECSSMVSRNGLGDHKLTNKHMEKLLCVNALTNTVTPAL